MSPNVYRRLYRGSLAVAILINLAIFIAATVELHRSSTWHYTDYYSTGHYTHESWACQMYPVFDRHDSDMRGICRRAVGEGCCPTCNSADIDVDCWTVAVDSHRRDTMRCSSGRCDEG